MSCSGAGRGRGWLKLTKDDVSRPGNSPSPPNYPNDSNTMCNAPAAQEYDTLISIISQVNTNDDGILLNQKLKAIVEHLKNEITTSEEALNCFKHIFQKCLEDEDFGQKFVWIMCSYTFMTLEIGNQATRKMFMQLMQATYEGREKLQASDPSQFRSAVRIHSEYLNKGRMLHGYPMRVLVSPLLSYFDMLLDSPQPADLELFVTQLYLNKALISENKQEELDDLINKIRRILISNADMPKISRIYLLLAVEIANNSSSLLPGKANNFYQEELGEQFIAKFQSAFGVLSIETQHSNKSLQNYKSNVNVLQVSPSSPIEKQIAQLSVSLKNLQKNQPPNNSWVEKPGRPILGAGARMNKDLQNRASEFKEKPLRKKSVKK